MATITAPPQTPATPLPAAPTPPTTGTWQHPRIAEIEQRREASTMTVSKYLRASVTLAILLATFFTPGSWIRAVLPASLSTLGPWALRLILAFSAAQSLSPLWTPPDEMDDIPLTPKQRKLLGLTPSSAPPTPVTGAGGAYVTPPRYARNTPRSESSRKAVAGSSPLGPQTPFSGSPLARKAMEGRRSSYGSPLGASLFDEGGGGSSRGSPGSGVETFSPSGKSASVGLNSKWLYQRNKPRMSAGAF